MYGPTTVKTGSDPPPGVVSVPAMVQLLYGPEGNARHGSAFNLFQYITVEVLLSFPTSMEYGNGYPIPNLTKDSLQLSYVQGGLSGSFRSSLWTRWKSS